MAWPVAFFTFVALSLGASNLLFPAVLAALASLAAFFSAWRRYGHAFRPALVVGAFFGAGIFFLRADFFAEKDPITRGTARVNTVSRRSVVLTLENHSRLRLIGFSDEKLPLKGALLEFACEPMPVPAGDFAVFERLSGIHLWCKKQYSKTLAEPRLAEFRSAALDFLHRRFAAIGEQSLIAPFLLGETETMPTQTLTAFRDMGLMHLFAVSGLNVALLFALLYVPFRWVGIPAVGGALGFLVATAFLLLLDFPVPLFRAWLFLAIGLLARLFDRKIGPWTLLFLTALFVEILIPLSTFTVSFILSFGITAAILLFYQPLFFCFNSKNRVRKLLASHIALTLAAGLPAFILSYLLFSNAQALALVYNLLLVPFSGLYLLSALVYILFDGALVVVQWLDALYLWFAELHATYAMRYLPVPNAPMIFLAIAVISLLLSIILYLQKNNRLWSVRRHLRIVIFFLAIALALPWLLGQRARQAFYAVPNKIHYFDAGTFYVAGESLFAAETPAICLPITTKIERRVPAGVIMLGDHCFAFASALKPELWRTNEFAACGSMQLFQAKSSKTVADAWKKLFRLFGLRGEVYLRNYFTWYADRALGCAKVQKL